MTAARPEPAAQETTDDAFLGGRLHLLQPKSGYRAGLDAVLLAAAVPAEEGGRARVLDAGAGVGAAGLAVAVRVPDAHVVLVELVSGLATLARENVARNGLSARVRVIEADICAPAASLSALGLEPQSFDHVLANPPYLEEGRGRRPLDPMKASAQVMAAGSLERWVRFLAHMAAPGGTVTLVHRAEALGELLAALRGRFGALSILPIHPRKGAPAHRVLVSGRKGSRATLRLQPGLVLHGNGNRFLPEVEAILRDGAPLALGHGG
jgi:tRNA1(Val) A37 N6-methylase TrmN6